MKSILAILVTAFFCILTLTDIGFAQDAFDAKQAFSHANEMTMRGEPEKALRLYDRVLERYPEDADILYNAGTSNLMAGRLGYAVLYLERALALDSGCNDCRVNLERVAELQADRVVVKQTDEQQQGMAFDKLMNGLSLDGLAVTLLVFHLLLFFIWILRRFIRSERSRFALALFMSILLLCDLTAGAFTALKAYRYEKAVFGVVLVEEAEVRKGPNQNYPTDFSVHEGLKVRLGESVEDWRQIWLENGLNGYLPSKELEAI